MAGIPVRSDMSAGEGSSCASREEISEKTEERTGPVLAGVIKKTLDSVLSSCVERELQSFLSLEIE